MGVPTLSTFSSIASYIFLSFIVNVFSFQIHKIWLGKSITHSHLVELMFFVGLCIFHESIKHAFGMELQYALWAILLSEKEIMSTTNGISSYIQQATECLRLCVSKAARICWAELLTVKSDRISQRGRREITN